MNWRGGERHITLISMHYDITHFRETLCKSNSFVLPRLIVDLTIDYSTSLSNLFQVGYSSLFYFSNVVIGFTPYMIVRWLVR